MSKNFLFETSASISQFGNFSSRRALKAALEKAFAESECQRVSISGHSHETDKLAVGTDLCDWQFYGSGEAFIDCSDLTDERRWKKAMKAFSAKHHEFGDYDHPVAIISGATKAKIFNMSEVARILWKEV